MVQLSQANKTSSDILKAYLLFSFVIAFVIAVGLFYMNENYLTEGFFSMALLIGSYFFFFHGAPQSDYVRETPMLSAFFVFQIFSLFGIGFSENDLSAMFLGLVPCFFGVYFFLAHERHEKKNVKEKKALALIFVTVLSYVIFQNIADNNILFQRSGIFFLSFLVWGAGIIYGGIMARRPEIHSAVFSLIAKSTTTTPKVQNEQKNRLFFHDLINQTHGINIFLSNRASLQKGLSAEECKSIVNEVKIIQSLAKDHFGYRHRNLVNTYDYVPFDHVKEGVIGLVHNFLPEHLVKCNFEFKGRLAEDNPPAVRDDCLVHYPSLNRIVVNLVKNISEIRGDDVEIIFDYNEDGLLLQVKNKVLNLKDTSENLAKKLQEIILTENAKSRISSSTGLGLESVATICTEQGGRFQFFIEGDYWVNRVFLPRPETQEIPLAA